MLMRNGLSVIAVLMLSAGSALVPMQDGAKQAEGTGQPSDRERRTAVGTVPLNDMQRWLRKFEGNWKVDAQDFTQRKQGTDDASGKGKDASRGREDDAARDKPKKSDDRAGGKSEYTARTVMVHNGRHAQTTIRGMTDGREFEGTRVLGYNNGAKRFEAFWMDNMSSGMAMSTGQLDEAQKTLTLNGEQIDSETGKKLQMREVTRWNGEEQYVTELYQTEPGSTEKQVMIFTFNRMRAGDSAGFPDSQIREPSPTQTNPR